MVVIAIIGILATIILASLDSARAKARDVRRKSDIHSLTTALSLYYLNHGAYPAISYAGVCGTAINGADIVSTSLMAEKLMVECLPYLRIRVPAEMLIMEVLGALICK
ncbi:hypothetical protein AUJ77_01655 [Candidatus Nomurabacteria bacterium CG1_02_43_90]|uniref:Type II secretion system protein GspG C-terminal domain-containing protein n=1 Tax=Candidatus Nomurabacteria bacterium CG1_02_43_90 TaxID=1805281 RepID=A0A1J4V6D1_9BACT|nr:MAG: hypothetical protein AUJ77_01655 [Candidatus Nomurabacteria bacterium CG1_02_43_90]